MVNNYANKNTGKLLAAVIAMLMVVCAVAVVAMPAEADDATSAPTFSGTETLTIDETVTSANIATELSTYYTEATKTLTVPADGLTITLAADMGTEKEPLDLNIVLNGDLKFTSENNNKIYITTSTLNGTSASTSSGDFTIEFEADNSVIQFDGVTAVLNNAVYSLISNMYPSVTGAMYVTGGANVTLKQDYSGSTWLNADGSDADETYLVVTGSSTERSVINFDGTRSIQGFVLDADYADINVHVHLCDNNPQMMSALIPNFGLADEETKAELRGWMERKTFDREEKVAAVRGIYDRLGVREVTERLIDQYLERSREILDRVGVAEERKADFREVLSAMGNRKK